MPYDEPEARVNKDPTVFGVLFSFSGRINRKTYWLKGMLPLWGALVLYYLFVVACASLSETAGVIALLLMLPLYLVFLISGIAVNVKRLHDRDRTGWWILAAYIPFVGLFIGIWLFIEVGFLKGDAFPNRYGDVP